jgi:indolepyruvate ferredoxin oxidoreductase alpha subunit
VIAAGFTYQKLSYLLDGSTPPPLRILRLGTFHPLPAQLVTTFLQSLQSALVLEENAPLVERATKAAAQSAGLTLPICGRDTGHVPQAGELFPSHLAGALNRMLPALALPIEGETRRSLPSRKPFPEGCPYIRIFDALTDVMDQKGGRDAFVVVGDPGCMVRSQLPPYELMDVKTSLGSSIGTATGIARGLFAAEGAGSRQVIALCGDSSFLHSGFGGLVDATRLGAEMLVMILDNGTTGISGGQPHAASRVDARGRQQRAADLAALVQATGAGMVRMVDLDAGEDIRPTIELGLDFEGVAVVIAHGWCSRCTGVG